jgi:hypothetical protein
MSTLVELATRLATNAVIGQITSPATIFQGPMPMTPDACVSVRRYGGGGVERAMGTSSTPVADSIHFQILVRDAAQSAGETKIAAILTALDNYSGTLGSTRYLLISLMYGPVDMGRDESNRFVWSLNFRALKARS